MAAQNSEENYFTDSEGELYTGDEISQMIDMPDGRYFMTMHVDDSVSRLPRNLKVEGDLIIDKSSNLKEIPAGTKVSGKIGLENSQVSRLPVGLEAASLSLKNSQIKHLPDNLRLSELDLTDTLVESIGSNIFCAYLYVSQFKGITQPITCTTLCVEDYSQDEIDLTNIKMESFYFYFRSESGVIPSPCVKKIKNAKANLLYISHNQTVETFIELPDSDIESLLIMLGGGSPSLSNAVHLHCGSGFVCDCINIDSMSKDHGVLNLTIEGAQINQILVYSPISEKTTLKGFLLCNDIKVASGDLNPNFLPETGIIYGNLTVPDHYEIPPGFTCLGEITRL